MKDQPPTKTKKVAEDKPREDAEKEHQDDSWDEGDEKKDDRLIGESDLEFEAKLLE